jgi:hypothetical protein
MTRQPAVDLRLHLPMTVEAKSHFKIYGLQPIQGFYISMTLRTIQPGPFDVGDVIKIDKIRHPKNSNPRNGIFPVIMLLFLENLGMVRNDVLMAEKTFLHRRQPGIGRPFHEGMTETAIDLFHPGMDAMAEVYRLLRANSFAGINVIEIEHGGEKEGNHSHPEIATLRSCRLRFHPISYEALISRRLLFLMGLQGLSKEGVGDR